MAGKIIKLVRKQFSFQPEDVGVCTKGVLMETKGRENTKYVIMIIKRHTI